MRSALGSAPGCPCRPRARRIRPGSRPRPRQTAAQRRIAKRVAGLGPQLLERLRQRVATLLDGREIQEERLLQEVALAVDRSDVTEELVRLGSHLDGLAAVLRGREPAGKRIDFLLQEVHREFNTIASKSVDLKVTNATMEARGEIEKLREQVQNVE
jgi:uncharacterized protein (TIGR00255 family)